MKNSCAHAFYQNVVSSGFVFDHPKQCGVNYFLFDYFYYLQTLSNPYLSFKEQYSNPVWIQNLGGFKPYIAIRKNCDATEHEMLLNWSDVFDTIPTFSLQEVSTIIHVAALEMFSLGAL